MKFRGISNTVYTTGREIGRGGEGIVYDIQDHTGVVLKYYSDPLPGDRLDKLMQMVSMRSPAIQAYAAWPLDIIADESGTSCGFVMRKLIGYVPLHTIFSPMDRKKLFPDKGYNFLVHVARNLATAFHKIHEAGLVVGDVNEGNILISSSGMVAFIDCDSFQVKGDNRYFLCEVGVPRYTPPELLKESTFEKVIRTTNTDSFSMAVLLFQLLFLGRHPFAGKNRIASDFDEETAIRKHEFAYSLKNKRKKLHPPKDSFSIHNLSDELVDLFHNAFEEDIRPEPAAWIKALDTFLADMITCPESALHVYPVTLGHCPWCAFRKESGILYFLDDSYLKANAVLNDMDSFVNGFDMKQMELRRWEKDAHLQDTVIPPSPVAGIFRRYRNARRWSMVTCFLFFVILYLLDPHRVGVLSLAFFFPFVIYRFSPWTIKLRAELERMKAEQRLISQKLEVFVTEFNSSADIANYKKGVEHLEKLINDFRRLPEEIERRLKFMEEQLYNEQLSDFLYAFRIEEHNIPLLGLAKKTALGNHGIRTAADIQKLQTIKVPGIGPKKSEALHSWCRQVSAGFVYIPVGYKIAEGKEKVGDEVKRIKLQLEHLIRKEYQSLTYLKMNISNRGIVLEKQINNLRDQLLASKANTSLFHSFVSAL